MRHLKRVSVHSPWPDAAERDICDASFLLVRRRMVEAALPRGERLCHVRLTFFSRRRLMMQESFMFFSQEVGAKRASVVAAYVILST